MNGKAAARHLTLIVDHHAVGQQRRFAEGAACRDHARSGPGEQARMMEHVSAGQHDNLLVCLVGFQADRALGCLGPGARTEGLPLERLGGRGFSEEETRHEEEEDEEETRRSVS